jgi:hypothetical protein
MKTKTQLLRRSCWWVLLAEGPLAGVILASASGPSAIGWKLFPFIVLAVLVNYPGLALAQCLSLFAPSGGLFEDGGKGHGVGLFGSQPGFDPTAGWIVVFAVGALCWVAVLWSLQIVFRGTESKY